MTEASQYLTDLAERLTALYAVNPKCLAVLLTGSAAEGISDFHSDLDLIVYHAELPSEAEFQTTRAAHGGTNLRIFGDAGEGETAEFFNWHGVECQVAHTTAAAWERDMASVLTDLDVTSSLQKAFSGMLSGKPLYGEAYIRAWQAHLAAYPDALARAMVEKHLSFFPIWSHRERLATRDALLWRQQIFVEAQQNLLAILAGLNRVYFTTFQFKRASAFLSKLRLTPDNLAERLESMFCVEAMEGILELEALVGETLTLVEQHMPEIDTSALRRILEKRYSVWQPTALPDKF